MLYRQRLLRDRRAAIVVAAAPALRRRIERRLLRGHLRRRREVVRVDALGDALGDHVFEWFLRNKRREWSRYEQHVSRYELEAYLPVL